MTTSKTEQFTATQSRDMLRLIPPLADEFTAGEPARAWALDGRYLLADGIPPCAHGLYLMASCPLGSCRTNFRQLDHARVWVPAGGMSRPFLLSHPYARETAAETKRYARAHGLRLAGACPGDDWCGHGTHPVRMTLPDGWPLWPIEHTIAVLLATQPVEWAAPLAAGQDAR